MQRFRDVIQTIQRNAAFESPQQVMHQLVLDIIAATDEEIAAAFEQIPADQIARVERHIKFMIHPDRNCHAMAKMAF